MGLGVICIGEWALVYNLTCILVVCQKTRTWSTFVRDQEGERRELLANIESMKLLGEVQNPDPRKGLRSRRKTGPSLERLVNRKRDGRDRIQLHQTLEGVGEWAKENARTATRDGRASQQGGRTALMRTTLNAGRWMRSTWHVLLCIFISKGIILSYFTLSSDKPSARSSLQAYLGMGY